MRGRKLGFLGVGILCVERSFYGVFDAEDMDFYGRNVLDVLVIGFTK